MNKLTKAFCCEHCETKGLIVIKSEEIEEADIVYCPVCSADIWEDEDKEDEEND